MEPWPFSHGYADHHRSHEPNPFPSMEPWPFSHGYWIWRRLCRRYLPPLQWSHGPSAMDTCDARRRRHLCLRPSMEPWPFSHGYQCDLAGFVRLHNGLQWSHGPSAMDTRAAGWPAGPYDFPSMEPWPFSHGYEGCRVRAQCWRYGFNGAMALQPWIQRNDRDYSPNLPRPHCNFRIQSPFHHPTATPILAFPSF